MLIKPILKLKVYSTQDKLPKLKPLEDGSKIRHSGTVLCWWRWARINRDKEIEVRLGRLVEITGEVKWQVDGITGEIEVLAYAPIKQLP